MVCGQLGLGRTGHAWSDAKFGNGTGPIWLDDVVCKGTEARLEDCAHLPYGTHDCDHGEDVGVTCF